ncbi:hypothetical protein [Thioclava dalianensis]|nr:hypothetical protein [Thioclava dalianensis]
MSQEVARRLLHSETRSHISRATKEEAIHCLVNHGAGRCDYDLARQARMELERERGCMPSWFAPVAAGMFGGSISMIVIQFLIIIDPLSLLR